jgi:hypothetical protein
MRERLDRGVVNDNWNNSSHMLVSLIVKQGLIIVQF